MCLGIPGKVVEVYREHDLLMGKVDFGGVLKRVCLEYVPDVAVGEYVLVHVGFALTQLDETEAEAGIRASGGARAKPIESRTGRRSMKFLDEYRDPATVARLRDAIRAAVTRPWVLMEVCGGQTHSIVRHGLDELLPPGVSLVHGPGLPGVRDAAGTDRPRARHRRAARRHLLLVRRHAPRAGQPTRPASR